MREKLGLSTFALKIIAITSMLIDHIGSVLLPDYNILRIIGRLSFPIFAFLVVEGYFHTRDVKKYLQRLFVFGVISEPFFDYTLHGSFIYLEAQNVFFTLYLGLLLIYICETMKNKKWKWLMFIVVAAISLFTFCNYNVYGIAMIYCFYAFRGEIAPQFIIMTIINVLLMGKTQSYAVFAMVPIFLYNGKAGKYKLKYFFYSFYPVHLAILGLISFLCQRP